MEGIDYNFGNWALILCERRNLLWRETLGGDFSLIFFCYFLIQIKREAKLKYTQRSFWMKLFVMLCYKYKKQKKITLRSRDIICIYNATRLGFCQMSWFKHFIKLNTARWCWASLLCCFIHDWFIALWHERPNSVDEVGIANDSDAKGEVFASQATLATSLLDKEELWWGCGASPPEQWVVFLVEWRETSIVTTCP